MEYNNIHHVSWTLSFFWWVGSDFDVNQPTSYQITVFPSHLWFNPLRPIFRTLAFSTSIALDFKSLNIFPKEFKAGDTGSSSVQSRCLGVYAGKVLNFTYRLFTSFHIQARSQGQKSIHGPKHKTTNIQREKKVMVKSCSTSLPTEDHSINPQRLRRNLKVEKNHLQKHPTN